MAIRQPYANEELIHKLRSMLNDLPALRTRAIKKLEHWREAAIKRILIRQRELEKKLIDKFERLESDTQLFVEKTERKKAQQQRRWQSEPVDYLSKSEIDRISTSLRSIREELEQSKVILAGYITNDNVVEIKSHDRTQDKVTEPSRDGDQVSPSTTTVDTSTATNDLGLELKRVLEICTSPPSLSPDEPSRLPSLDHAACTNDTPTQTSSTTLQQRRTNHINNPSRRHARIITDVCTEQEQKENTNLEVPSKKDQKPAAFESCDDSVRRFQRLREIRKTLRTKYDANASHESVDDDSRPTTTNDVVDERQSSSSPTRTTNQDIMQLYDQTANSVRTRDKKIRSRTLEGNQLRAVDNQIYGCSSSKSKNSPHHRSESHKNCSHNLPVRRLSDDFYDQKLLLRRHLNSPNHNLNEMWFEVDHEHWTNLLENGWRPTSDTPGVNLVSFTDEDNRRSRKHKKDDKDGKIVDPYNKVSRTEYTSLFEHLDFAYARTIDLGNEFWRFLEIKGHHHLCLYHQLNKQFIMYKPDSSLLSFPWPYDGIVDIAWSKPTNTWAVATQTQTIICNHSFSKILESIDVHGDWPKRITSCRSSIFHTYKIPPSSITSSPSNRSTYMERPQFLLERFDYKLNSLCKHILESSTIWDVEADDLTEHVAVLCDVALLIFDYQLNLLRQIEVTGFKVTRDHFGGWLIADYNASCIWQIRRNEYLKAHKILNVERPWSVILDRNIWTLVTLSETQQRAKRLLFFTAKNLPSSLRTNELSTKSQLSSSSSSLSESFL